MLKPLPAWLDFKISYTEKSLKKLSIRITTVEKKYHQIPPNKYSFFYELSKNSTT